MNERFKELEKQCWSHRVEGALVDGQLHFDTKKFAELIVQECMDVVAKKCASPTAYNALAEHFGVEE
jgi:hypothetical protein